MIYLDAAAVVKLAHLEVHSHALRSWLGERAEVGWASSVLVQIESFRAVARAAPRALAKLVPILDMITLFEMDSFTCTLAQTVQPATVRSLDAIHLATAQHLGASLTAFVTYDRRLIDAVSAAGLPVAMPT